MFPGIKGVIEIQQDEGLSRRGVYESHRTVRADPYFNRPRFSDAGFCVDSFRFQRQVGHRVMGA